MKAVLIYHCGVSYNAGSVTLYPVCIRNLSYLLEMLQFQSYHIQSAEEQMKPCHIAVAAWWDEASPAVRTEDFQCVHACSIQSSHSAFQRGLV